MSHIGATWFVSYAYFKTVDKNHLAWKNVKTYPTRISSFNRTSEYHIFWLKEVLKMNKFLLNTNKLGILGEETKIMAQRILNKIVV